MAFKLVTVLQNLFQLLSPLLWARSINTTILGDLRSLRFDKTRSSDSGSTAGGALVPADGDEAPGAEVDFEPWRSEPVNVTQLMDQYNLESKFSGRFAATSLYVVQATARDGSRRDVVEGQDFKLFLVT